VFSQDAQQRAEEDEKMSWSLWDSLKPEKSTMQEQGSPYGTDYSGVSECVRGTDTLSFDFRNI